MSKKLWTILGWSVGVLCCLAVVVAVSNASPKVKQGRVDTCLASAVRTYPNIGGRELKVAELKDCQGLTDTELNGVRADLQAFGIEAATRVAKGQ